MLWNILKWQTQGHQYGLTKHFGVRKPSALAQEQTKHRSGKEFPGACFGLLPLGYVSKPNHLMECSNNQN